MKCMSCDVEINPQWKHAIDLNSCPFCGQEIMNGALQSMLCDLRETLDAITLSFPEELEDWLYSNYGFSKGGKPKRTHNGDKHTVKIKNLKGEEEEVEVETIQDENTTSSFFERSGAIKSSSKESAKEKTENLKRLAEKVRSGNGDEGLLMIEEDQHLEPLSYNELNQLSSLSKSDEDDYLSNDDEIPNLVANMASRARNKEGHVADPFLDIDKRQRNAANAMANGEGKFRR